MKRILRTSDKFFPVWIDIENPDKEELIQLAHTYGLNREIVVDCLDPQHLPKYEENEEFVFIIGRLYDANATSEAVDVLELTRKIAIFSTENVLITVHRSPQQFIEEVCRQLLLIDNKHAPNRFHVIALLLDRIILSYESLSEQISDQLDEYEDLLFLQSQIPDLTRKFYYSKRRAAIVLKVLGVSKLSINKLEQRVKGPIMQDLNDSFVSVNTSFENIFEHSNSLISTYLSLTSQKTNEIMRTLTILSVFFMPLTFIVGVYGMNFELIPEFKWPYGYVYVWLLMLSVSVGIAWFFKKQKWM